MSIKTLQSQLKKTNARLRDLQTRRGVLSEQASKFEADIAEAKGTLSQGRVSALVAGSDITTDVVTLTANIAEMEDSIVRVQSEQADVIEAIARLGEQVDDTNKKIRKESLTLLQVVANDEWGDALEDAIKSISRVAALSGFRHGDLDCNKADWLATIHNIHKLELENNAFVTAREVHRQSYLKSLEKKSS